MEEDYINVNRKAWNKKVGIHLESDFYGHKKFLEGKNSLNEIELAYLADMEGKKILHLQCHFGQDSISLARMGAKVTAVDFSNEAIDAAKQINTELGLDVEFICSDIYKLPEVLDKQFDLIFTSYGVLGWLSDMNKWAQIINHFLSANGELLLVEFHPSIWMYDDDCKKVKYNYFNVEEIVEVYEGTYANQEANLRSKYIMWNHDLSEIMMSLINNGLEIKSFKEYNYSPYNCFLGMEKIGERKFQIKVFKDKFPLVFSISAKKAKLNEL